MFETMMREMLLKMIREDAEFRREVISLVSDVYNAHIQHAVKYVIESDEQVQDVIRKQVTMDIGELITDLIQCDEGVNNTLTDKIVRAVNNDERVIDSITERIDQAISGLTFEVSVS